MDAAKLRDADDKFNIHLGALAERTFKSTDTKGKKYLYNKIDDLFKYDEVVSKILGNKKEPEKAPKESLESQQARLKRAKEIVAERRRKRGG